MALSDTCPSCDAPCWTHPPQSVMCEMLHKMQKDNLALREMVGKMEGLLRLTKDTEVHDGQR